MAFVNESFLTEFNCIEELHSVYFSQHLLHCHSSSHLHLSTFCFNTAYLQIKFKKQEQMWLFSWFASFRCFQVFWVCSM